MRHCLTIYGPTEKFLSFLLVGFACFASALEYPSSVQAQQIPFVGGQVGPSWYYSNSQDLQDRVDELSKSAIPTNELALTRELDRIDNELLTANSEINRLGGSKDWDPTFDGLIRKLAGAKSTISAADCEQQLSTFQRASTDYNTALSGLYTFFQYLQGVDLSPLQMEAQARGVDGCKLVRDQFTKADFTAKVESTIDSLKKRFEDAKNTNATSVDQYTKLVRALRERRAKLQNALNTRSPQQQITANLPIILMILGGACVLAIIGVRFFDREIQMEWVASGQVIQFVTVMVLLSVITALALSDVLKENTLGTLLGGIAGYVLAQGVGRAAARDVARGVRSTQDTQQRTREIMTGPGQSEQATSRSAAE